METNVNIIAEQYLFHTNLVAQELKQPGNQSELAFSHGLLKTKRTAIVSFPDI